MSDSEMSDWETATRKCPTGKRRLGNVRLGNGDSKMSDWETATRKCPTGKRRLGNVRLGNGDSKMSDWETATRKCPTGKRRLGNVRLGNGDSKMSDWETATRKCPTGKRRLENVRLGNGDSEMSDWETATRKCPTGKRRLGNVRLGNGDSEMSYNILSLTCSAINCLTIVLDSNTGEAVFFKINPFSQQYFEVHLVNLSDLNVVIHVAEKAVGMQLRASFCHQHGQDYKVIADNIGGSISRLLTHEELLALKFWTSCSTNNELTNNILAEKNPRKFFLGLFFQPQPAYAQLTKRIQEMDVSISAKLLPISSSPSNVVRSRRGMQPDKNYEPITNYSLMVVNETKVVEFALHNFSLPINVSVTKNLGGSNGPDVQVFASICAERTGAEPITEINSSSHYNSILLKASNLMPADLVCKYDVANPKLLLSLRLHSGFNHIIGDTSVNGTVAVWQSPENRDGGDQSDDQSILKHWRRDIRLAENQSVEYELQKTPLEVHVSVRLGSVQVHLYNCANSTSKPQPILLGNFFTGSHHIPLNWTLLQDNCILNQENISSNDLLTQDLLHNNSVLEANQANLTGLALSLIGTQADNIVWVNLNYNDPNNLLVVKRHEDDSSSSIWPVLLLLLFLVVIAIGLGLMAHQLVQRRRTHRYRIQKKVVLQRQNSLRPSAHNHLRVPTTSGVVIASTDTDTNISAFEMSDRGWAT